LVFEKSGNKSSDAAAETMNWYPLRLLERSSRSASTRAHESSAALFLWPVAEGERLLKFHSATLSERDKVSFFWFRERVSSCGRVATTRARIFPLFSVFTRSLNTSSSSCELSFAFPFSPCRLSPRDLRTGTQSHAGPQDAQRGVCCGRGAEAGGGEEGECCCCSCCFSIGGGFDLLLRVLPPLGRPRSPRPEVPPRCLSPGK